MVPLTLGSQTVGSVLRPAAFCGVVGVKPTYGRVSRRGVVPLAWSLDHVGVFARSVADAALAVAVLSGHDPADPGSADCAAPGRDGGPCRAARAAPAIRPHRRALSSTARQTRPGRTSPRSRASSRRGGRSSSPSACRPSMAVMQSAVITVSRAEIGAVHADAHRRHAGEYRPRIRAGIELGQCIPADLYLRAQRIRRRARQDMAPLLARYDALVMPSAPGAGPRPDDHRRRLVQRALDRARGALGVGADRPRGRRGSRSGPSSSGRRSPRPGSSPRPAGSRPRSDSWPLHRPERVPAADPAPALRRPWRAPPC